MQAPDCLLISPHHRDRQRCVTMMVFGFQISAKLDEKVEDVVAFSVYREMERRLSIFEAGHAPIERLRIFLDQFANQIEVAERDCRENVVARPALNEQ